MEEIRRIESPVKTPQPVGKSHQQKKPGGQRNEFQEILEREQGEAQEEERRETSDQKRDERSQEQEIPADRDPDRGLLLDERV